MKVKELNEFNFPNIQIHWYDRMGLYQITPMKVAKIELTSSWSQDNYDSYKVTIIGKDMGIIDSHIFYMRDFLHKKQRADSSKNYDGAFHINNESGDYSWYIAIPTEENIAVLESNIMSYINMFQEEIENESMEYSSR